MRAAAAGRLLLPFLLALPLAAASHPLKLSLCEIEYASEEARLTISLRLFLTDVNEALVFDPDNDELAFARPGEAPGAEAMLLDYLARFFEVKVNGVPVDLVIREKTLSGEGQNTALGLLVEQPQPEPVRSLEIRNAVFTDLFFDQTNIVYVHVDDDTRSLMLNKRTPAHALEF